MFQYERPNTAVSYEATGSTTGKNELKNNAIDFGGSDSLFSASDYAAFPDLAM